LSSRNVFLSRGDCVPDGDDDPNRELRPAAARITANLAMTYCLRCETPTCETPTCETPTCETLIIGPGLK